MAKRKKKAAKSAPMTCPTGKCGPTCVFMSLLASVAAAFGLWLLVAGVMKQWSGMSWTGIWTWYFGGFVLWCVAKCFKMKACGACR